MLVLSLMIVFVRTSDTILGIDTQASLPLAPTSCIILLIVVETDDLSLIHI